MSNRISPVFSVSVFAILASVGASSYLLHNSNKVNNLIREEDKVLAPLSEPKVEAPTPTPVKEVVIEAPKPQVKKLATLKAKVVTQAALAQAAQPCELVCEDNWNDSNYGGRFKKCECKK